MDKYSFITNEWCTQYQTNWLFKGEQYSSTEIYVSKFISTINCKKLECYKSYTRYPMPVAWTRGSRVVCFGRVLILISYEIFIVVVTLALKNIFLYLNFINLYIDKTFQRKSLNFLLLLLQNFPSIRGL